MHIMKHGTIALIAGLFLAGSAMATNIPPRATQCLKAETWGLERFR